MPATNWPTAASWPAATAWPNATNWPGGVTPVDPATLAGLALWFDGRAPAFSDAGVTPATQPQGRVQRLNQPSPLANYWNATSSAARPWREANALDFRAGEPSQVGQFGTPTIASDNSSVGFAFTARAGHSAEVIFAGAGAPGTWGVSVGSYTLTITYAGSYSFGVKVVPGAKVAGVLTFVGGNIEARGFVDGVPFYNLTARTLNAGLMTAAFVGNGGLGPGQFAMSQLIYVNGALSVANRDGLLAFLQNNLPGEPPTGSPLFYATGDSICTGTGANGWPYLVQKALDDAATPVTMYNGGLHSGGMTGGGLAGITIPAYASAYVAPRYSAARAKNIVIMQGITNSINCDTPDVAATAAAFLAANYAMCDALKAQGWLVILTTCTPCSVALQSSGLKGTGFEATRQLVNADMLSNYLAHGSAMCDFGNQPGMTTTVDASGANFVDGLHPSAAGYIIMANAATPVVAALL